MAWREGPGGSPGASGRPDCYLRCLPVCRHGLCQLRGAAAPSSLFIVREMRATCTDLKECTHGPGKSPAAALAQAVELTAVCGVCPADGDGLSEFWVLQPHLPSPCRDRDAGNLTDLKECMHAQTREEPGGSAGASIRAWLLCGVCLAAGQGFSELWVLQPLLPSPCCDRDAGNLKD